MYLGVFGSQPSIQSNHTHSTNKKIKYTNFTDSGVMDQTHHHPDILYLHCTYLYVHSVEDTLTLSLHRMYISPACPVQQ